MFTPHSPTSTCLLRSTRFNLIVSSYSTVHGETKTRKEVYFQNQKNLRNLHFCLSRYQCRSQHRVVFILLYYLKRKFLNKLGFEPQITRDSATTAPPRHKYQLQLKIPFLFFWDTLSIESQQKKRQFFNLFWSLDSAMVGPLHEKRNPGFKFRSSQIFFFCYNNSRMYLYQN